MPDTTEFVTAYSKTTGRKQRVPARWLDHPILGANLRKTPMARAGSPISSVPDDSGTVSQLREHADQAGIDLTGTTNKADDVAATHTNPPATGESPQED